MLMEGLRDGDRLVARLQQQSRGLVVHGHLHQRMQSRIPTEAGELRLVGAASASLHHEHEARMAGFNVYTFDEGGAVTAIDAHVLDAASASFHVERVPDGRW